MTRRQWGLIPALGLPSMNTAAAPQTEWLEWMQIAGVPGISAVTVQRGRPPRFRPAGVTKTGGSPVTPDTVFAAASLSKQLVAYAALELEAKGLLDLNRPLGDSVALNDSPAAGRVTARMVLSHSTGFPNWRFKPGEPLTPGPNAGREYQYSGEGYVYLQRVLEKITGKPFARLMREVALDPLRMTASSFAWRVNGEQAPPHNRQGLPVEAGGKRREQLDLLGRKWNLEPEDWTVSDLERAGLELKSNGLPVSFEINAAASLLTTGRDYARFLEAALRRPRFGEWLVTVRGPLGWGNGWGLEQRGKDVWWWQWGDNTGYKNFVFAEPKRGFGVAVFTNGDKGRGVYQRVVAQLIGFEPQAFLWL